MTGSATLTTVAAGNAGLYPVQVEGQGGRSEQWVVYLYGDMTITVMGSRRADNCGFLRQ